MLNIDWVSLFWGIPDQLATLLIAMLPIAELRAAIPIAIGVYELSIPASFFLSVAGNLIPIVFILLWLEPASAYLRKKSPVFDKFFLWLFERT